MLYIPNTIGWSLSDVAFILWQYISIFRYSYQVYIFNNISFVYQFIEKTFDFLTIINLYQKENWKNISWTQICYPKGHLISKFHFGTYLQFSQKTNEKIRLYSSRIVFVRFWENWRYQKEISKLTYLYQLFSKHFETYFVKS